MTAEKGTFNSRRGHNPQIESFLSFWVSFFSQIYIVPFHCHPFVSDFLIKNSFSNWISSLPGYTKYSLCFYLYFRFSRSLHILTFLFYVYFFSLFNLLLSLICYGNSLWGNLWPPLLYVLELRFPPHAGEYFALFKMSLESLCMESIVNFRGALHPISFLSSAILCLLTSDCHCLASDSYTVSCS